MDRGLSSYLAHYAAPEAQLAGRVIGRFSLALVVPLHRESSTCLNGYFAALERCEGSPLLLLVVNSDEESSLDARDQTEALLLDLVRLTRATLIQEDADTPKVSPLYRGRFGRSVVLIVDRCSSGNLLPARAGAGLARKIGNDLAVSLFELGRLSSRVLFQTDGDVELPATFFEGLSRIEPSPGLRKSPAAAWVVPFRHVPGPVPAEYAATLQYEIRLRYHVYGLRHAGCAFAWHSLGSSMAVEVFHYAAVRGFPKRPAGEDFYLLNKLSKLGPVATYPGEPVRICSRRSDRVPFGTGPAVEKLLTETPQLHDFQIFEGLRRCNRALDAFARGAARQELKAAFLGSRIGPSMGPNASDSEWRATQAAWQELGLDEALRKAVRGAPLGNTREQRVRDTFDALKTLRFLHALRDALYPDVPMLVALSKIPGFDLDVGLAEPLGCEKLEEFRDWFVRRENQSVSA